MLVTDEALDLNSKSLAPQGLTVPSPCQAAPSGVTPAPPKGIPCFVLKWGVHWPQIDVINDVFRLAWYSVNG